MMNRESVHSLQAVCRWPALTGLGLPIVPNTIWNYLLFMSTYFYRSGALHSFSVFLHNSAIFKFLKSHADYKRKALLYSQVNWSIISKSFSLWKSILSNQLGALLTKTCPLHNSICHMKCISAKGDHYVDSKTVKAYTNPIIIWSSKYIWLASRL